MDLPREVLDQIVGEFISETPTGEFFSLRSLDQWRDFIASGNFTPANRDQIGYESLAHVDLDIEHLLKLRLVSRGWNASVSRLLHKDLWWNVNFDEAERMGKIGECCDHSNGHFPERARKLCLTGMKDLNSFTRQYSYEPQKFRGQDVDSNYIMLNSAYSDILSKRRTRPEDRMLHYDKTKEHAVLRSLFDRLVEIEGFSVSFPVAESDIEYITDCYDMKGVSDMIAALQYGLNRPAFQHLKDLSLLVPSTWHIGRLAGSFSQEARDRLIRLRLVIQDETGPCGSLDRSYYDESNDGDTTTFVGTGHASSNLQIAYPNREHQNALWALVASCQNLESLAIHATHYLDLKQLKWDRAAGYRGLKHLSLHRVWTDIAAVMMFLLPSAGSELSSVARRVNLDGVKIYSDGGNWETFFDFLRNRCPDLEFFRASELTYFSNHINHLHNPRLWENSNYTWTSSWEDDGSLRRLEERMNHSEESSSDFDFGYTIWKRSG